MPESPSISLSTPQVPIASFVIGSGPSTAFSAFGAGVTSLNGQIGGVNISGAGSVYVTNDGRLIIVSGSASAGGGGGTGAVTQADLAATGALLNLRIDSLSGWAASAQNLYQTGATLYALINGSSAGVISVNGASGALNLTGAGTVTVTRAGQLLTISGMVSGGAGDVTFSQLAATGSYLESLVTGASGYSANTYATKAQLTSTGVTLGGQITTVASNLTTTGSVLNGRITGLSGYSDTTFATKVQLTNTGVTFGARIDTVSANISATGSTLDNKINGLSGYSSGVYAAKTDLINTGNTLVASINTVATNLATTGSDLFNRDLSISGALALRLTNTGVILGDRIAQTGQAAWTAAQNNATNLSGNLGATGSILISLISAASAGVSSLNGSSGVMSIVGAGVVTVTTNGQTITVSGSSGAGGGGDVTSAQLTLTGQTLGAKIDTLSGYSDNTFATKAQLTSTGVTLGSRIDTVVSNLASTGTTLDAKITSLSGYSDSTFATRTNLTATGSQLYNFSAAVSGNLTQSGVALGSRIGIVEANTLANAINLSGRLTSTGVLLGARIDTLTSNVAANAANLSGALTLTGVTLIDKINSVSGWATGRFLTGLIGGSNITVQNNLDGTFTVSSSATVASSTGAYIFRTNITNGVTTQFVPFPVTLGGQPKVLVSVGNNTNNTVLPYQVSGITSTGYWLIFGNSVSNTGYFAETLSTTTDTGLAISVINQTINNVSSGSSLTVTGSSTLSAANFVGVGGAIVWRSGDSTVVISGGAGGGGAGDVTQAQLNAVSGFFLTPPQINLNGGTGLRVNTYYYDTLSTNRTLGFNGTVTSGSFITLRANVTNYSQLSIPNSYEIGGMGITSGLNLSPGNHILSWTYTDNKWWLTDSASAITVSAPYAPRNTDDYLSGYQAGASFWLDTSVTGLYVCLNDSISGAVWYRVNNPTGVFSSVLLSGQTLTANASTLYLNGTAFSTGAGATVENLATTGTILNNRITSLSGYSDATFATKVQLTSTGILLGSRIDTVTSNLATTGTDLLVRINSLSGYSDTLFATKTQLTNTGVTLGSQTNTVASNLGSTGSQLYSFSSAISGNLTQTGVLLGNQINTVSTNAAANASNLSGNLTQTGISLGVSISTVSNTVGLVSGNLTQTGVTLIAADLSLSGALGLRLTNTGINLASSVASTGQAAWTAAQNNALNLSGSLTASGQRLTALTVTGSSVLNTANLVGLGGTLVIHSGTNVYISGGAGAGGVSSSQLESTGQQAWTAANNNALNLSGNLTQTGSILIGLINAASAGVSSINGASGVVTVEGAGNVFVITNGQTITVSGNTGAYAGFASKIELTTTGQTLGARIDATDANVLANAVNLSGRLAATGSQLYSMAAAISGNLTQTGVTLGSQINVVSNNTIANGLNLSGDLTQTGISLGSRVDGLTSNSTANANNLSGRLALTGSQLYSFAATNSGNLIQTGVSLGLRITTVETNTAANATNLSGRLTATGSQLYSFATSNSGNLIQTGVLLGSRVDTVITNLTATGSQLYSFASAISGNLTQTGVALGSRITTVETNTLANATNLSGRLAATGTQLYNFAAAISGNLTQTGVTLGARIDLVSSSNVANGLNLSGNLTQTGVLLGARIDTLTTTVSANASNISGRLTATGQLLSAVSITGSTVVNNPIFTGIGGTLVILSGDRTVLISGAGGGAGGGVTPSQLEATGQQAWTAADNNASNLSGDLSATGNALWQRDLAISGALQAQIGAGPAPTFEATGAYIFRTAITQGQSVQFIPFPVSLGAAPRVFASVGNDQYNTVLPFQVSGVVSTGYWLLFANDVPNTGYYVETLSTTAQTGFAISIINQTTIISGLGGTNVSTTGSSTLSSTDITGAGTVTVSLVGTTTIISGTAGAGGGAGSSSDQQVLVNANNQVSGSSSLIWNNTGNYLDLPNGGAYKIGGRDLFQPLRVPFVNSAVTATNSTLAPQFFANSFGYVTYQDLSSYTGIRFIVNKVTTAGATNSAIFIRYLGHESTTPAQYLPITSPEMRVPTNNTNRITISGFNPIVDGAKSGVYLALITSGGDGALDPIFGNTSVMFM